MNCPKCHRRKTMVVDSRPYPDCVRRRRRCAKCQHKWTTYELFEGEPVPSGWAEKIDALEYKLAKALDHLRKDL